jgi:hypothetical protein
MTEVASTDPVVSEAAIVDNEEDESKVRGSTTTPTPSLKLYWVVDSPQITVTGNSSYEATR